MIKKLKIYLGFGPKRTISDYSGFSDFFLHAPDEEKKQVIKEAAERANSDQMKIFKEARFKTRTN